MKHLFSSLALCLATIAGFAQCDSSADHIVEATSNLTFVPATLTIEQGQSVAFLNVGGNHDVNGVTNTVTQESFENPVDFSFEAVMATDEPICIGTYTFDTPGTYNYDCSIYGHAAAGMVGTITVNALPTNTVVDVIVNSPDHELLEAAVLAADLAGALSAEGPFTVFAPTDDAIGALVAALEITAEDLLALENLGEILTYHVVAGEALSSSLMDGQMIATLLGPDVTVSITEEGVFINDAMVTVADIPADNGVVHVIDAVLLPPAPVTNTVVDVIVNSPDHELLEAAVLAADLAGALSAEGPFTVFAPTDDAIGALVAALEITAEDLLALENLGEILTYHVVAGEALSSSLMDGQMIATLLGPDVTVSITEEGAFINDAMVTVADIPADNGVVHVIDAVLLPPAPVTNTVVDVIVNSPDHELLEAAVLAADLAGALSAEGPFTVFAPTDDAIGALVAALEITAEDLLALENLGEILTYHVVAGEALSSSLMDGQMIATLLGPDVTVSITEEGVFINDAMVTVADIPADNGVVHVIDAVLLPPAPVTNTIWDIVEGSDVHNYLEAALLQQGLDGALSDTTVLTLFAPTDAAFEAAAVAYGTDIDGLLALPYLTDILLYHVTGGAVMSTDLSDGQVVTMLNEGTATVTIDMGVFINNAQVTGADNIADNGVVHILDALIQPAADGIQEAQASWNVMPNPASFEVRFAGLTAEATAVVLDLTGRQVAQLAAGNNVLSVGHMAPGTYVVAVTSNGSVTTSKLVVR